MGFNISLFISAGSEPEAWVIPIAFAALAVFLFLSL